MLNTVHSGPATTLARVLDHLGSTLLELVHGPTNLDKEIGGFTIFDSVDDRDWPHSALVLGVGVHEPSEIVGVMKKLSDREAVGLILRAQVPSDPSIVDAASRHGLAVISLTPGASWVQLTSMLESLLTPDESPDGEPHRIAGVVSGDLFSVANAVAALVDAPITIEDRSSRILAFSDRQEEADVSRVESILGRRVSSLRTKSYESRGVFKELYREHGPIYVESDGIDGVELPRTALAVRAGEEILGSIWVAKRERLTPDQIAVFCDLAKMVAVHMLNHRVAADVDRRVRTGLVATLLDGSAGATDAGRRLGFARRPSVVLALGHRVGERATAADFADRAAERERITDAFTMHLTAAHPAAAVALIGDTTYGIIPVVGSVEDSPDRAIRIANKFLDRVGVPEELAVGIGGVAQDGSGLAASRDGADQALSVIRAQTSTRLVAHIDEVAIDALLIDFGDMAAERIDNLKGPIARIVEYDRDKNTDLLGALIAWLAAFGNVSEAAETAFLHTNTLRYRLRRATEVGGIDLSHHDTRLNLMLQLRLMGRI